MLIFTFLLFLGFYNLSGVTLTKQSLLLLLLLKLLLLLFLLLLLLNREGSSRTSLDSTAIDTLLLGCT